MVSKWVRFRIKHCFLLLVGFPLAFLQGQSVMTPFFTLSTEHYEDLPSTAQAEIDRIHEEELISFETMSSYHSLESVQTDGWVYATHPITGEGIYFQVRYTEFFEEGYYWYGEVSGEGLDVSSIEYGTLNFTKYNDYVFGSIAWPEEIFQFESIEGDQMIIYELAEGVCGHLEETSGLTPPPPVPPVHHCDVDIVALYTENFRKKIDGGGVGNTEKTKAIIRSKIAESNAVMARSQLDVYFKFNLVGIVASAFVEENEEIRIEQQVHLNPSSQSGEMFNARQANNADVSLIFTHGKYKNEAGSRIGGTSGSITLNSSLAYALIEKKGLKNKKKLTHTTAHELSHLLHATHFNVDIGALPYGSFIETPRTGAQLIFTHNGSLMQAAPVRGVIHRPRII